MTSLHQVCEPITKNEKFCYKPDTLNSGNKLGYAENQSCKAYILPATRFVSRMHKTGSKVESGRKMIVRSAKIFAGE